MELTTLEIDMVSIYLSHRGRTADAEDEKKVEGNDDTELQH